VKLIQLEHIIRAAGSITGCKEIVCVGSQAILASFPKPPDEMTMSMEADVYPLEDPAKADLVEGTIGELSPFHETFGYYAHGVAPETAILPKNWKKRIVRLENENTNGYAGLCLSPVDIAASKIIAGREKDLSYFSAMLKHGMITNEDIKSILMELPELHRNKIPVQFTC
jgi:hypothetical protein